VTMENPLINIILQPIGNVSLEDLNWLKESLMKRMPILTRVTINIWSIQPPLIFYNWERMQYRADELALWLLEKYRGFLFPKRRLVLGIVNSDGYVEGLNFVFGIALPKKGVALVFTKKLRHRANEVLYRERLLKESMHEIGHLLGLSHCPDPKCVMSFSNSLADVDNKYAEFCKQCKAKIIRLLGRSDILHY
jgi:archaemetzincin